MLRLVVNLTCYGNHLQIPFAKATETQAIILLDFQYPLSYDRYIYYKYILINFIILKILRLGVF